MKNVAIDLFAESANDLLETEIAESFLVEYLAEKKAEVFENVVFFKKRRYYIEDLTVRDFSLENTTPYQIKIGDTIIEEHAWVKLLCEVTKYLLKESPKTNEELLNFSCHWTKTKMFATEKKTNFKIIYEGLYLNCNHTALHSCWLLQNILDLFSIDKSSVYFLIHRPCGAEPANVKEYIEKRFIRCFLDYLMVDRNINDCDALDVIKSFEYINKLLASVSKSYTNFFLFDDNATLQNYSKKVEDEIKRSECNDDDKEKFINNIALLVDYYKQ